MMVNNIYFLSFGGPNKDYIDAVTRICNQAHKFYLFKKIYRFTDQDLKDDNIFWSKHKDFILNNPRGYGYWLWKSYLIKKTLENISYGDFLLYCDSGCEMNFYGKNHIKELIKKTKQKLIIGTRGSSNDITFTKQDTIEYFNMRDNPKLSEDHMQCTALMMIKCDKIVSLINEWYETGSSNYNLIDDTYSIKNDLRFLDHRHDQSIFNMIVKRDNLINYDLEPTDWGCEYAAHENYLKNGINYPIWTCRNRYGKSMLGDLHLNNILSELAKKYNTDKYDHGFTNLYYDRLNKFEYDNFNLLEIGVQWGSSIKMWNEFFKNATIYAADNYLGINGNKSVFNNPTKFIYEVKNNKIDRTNIVYLDQSNNNELIDFVNKYNNIKFKIIIDDGSHLMKDQQISFYHLFDLIEPGGYYIIENLQTSRHSGYDLLSDGSNSTKLMLERAIDKKILESYYFYDTEKCKNIINNIDNIEFNYFLDDSEVVIIKKIIKL